jgi:hypothetical protein
LPPDPASVDKISFAGSALWGKRIASIKVEYAAIGCACGHSRLRLPAPGILASGQRWVTGSDFVAARRSDWLMGK